MFRVISFAIVISLVVNPGSLFACTIFSAIARDGQVWNGNNEDGPNGVANFINVFPKSQNVKYGYFTLSFLSPKLGEGGNIQGGMNEAGLTFDFNSISIVKNFDPKSKKAFHLGDAQILPTILGQMSSVEEVVRFFETYWFQHGFVSAQMHVADRQGRFAIISASGIRMVKRGQFLVSTNFDICGKEDSSSCWRYPIAISTLEKQGASLSTMISICKETAQRTSYASTLYSNVQNLTTGDVWFFSNHDAHGTIKTNIREMIAKGRQSYTFNDLRSLTEKRPLRKVVQPATIDLQNNIIKNYAGTFQNEFVGNVLVQAKENGISISYSNGSTDQFQPASRNSFFIPGEDVRVEFIEDSEHKKLKASFYQDGFWRFDVWKSDEN